MEGITMKKIIISLPLIIASFLLIGTFISENALAQPQQVEKQWHPSKTRCRVVCKWKHGRRVCYKDCVKCKHHHCVHYRIPIYR